METKPYHRLLKMPVMYNSGNYCNRRHIVSLVRPSELFMPSLGLTKSSESCSHFKTNRLERRREHCRCELPEPWTRGISSKRAVGLRFLVDTFCSRSPHTRACCQRRREGTQATGALRLTVTYLNDEGCFSYISKAQWRITPVTSG